MAPGSFLLSANAHPDKVGECDDSDGLTFRSGTSMSAPVVAGTALLLRQYFQQGWHITGSPNITAGFSPHASLIKAVLLNGGQPLIGIQDRKTGEVSSSTRAYDFNQGYGRVNLIRSVPLMGENKISGIFVNAKEISDGEKVEYPVVIAGDDNGSCESPLSVTL